MVARLRARLLQESTAAQSGADHYDAVILLGGTNDLWRCDPAAVAAKMCECHDVARAALPDAAIGVCTVPRWNPGVVQWFDFMNFESKVEAGRARLNELLREHAEQMGPAGFVVELADALDPTMTDANDCTVAAGCGDGIHFSLRGYERVGRIIAEALTEHDNKKFVAVMPPKS